MTTSAPRAIANLRLPRADRSLVPYVPSSVPRVPVLPQPPPRSRIAYAAAHVVADPLSAIDPALGGQIDWETTLAYRRHLWSQGFAVAEAMDTAQRGMGLSYGNARELISRSAEAAHAAGGTIASGANTDHLDPQLLHDVDAIERAYLEQCAFIEGRGSGVILMASRALPRIGATAAQYARVYTRILQNLQRPVILHWLGPMFDPQLTGYWGSEDLDRATETFLEIISWNGSKVDGVKISLLDAEREIAVRRRLPSRVRVYTGDDFNYPELIAGDGDRHSDALLGIFDAIAPAARAALAALDANDRAAYDAILAPTVALSRHIFTPPTYAYKTGIVFLAYLNGAQSHFRMIGGAEGARSVVHLARLLELADEVGLIIDQERAAERAARVFATAGIV